MHLRTYFALLSLHVFALAAAYHRQSDAKAVSVTSDGSVRDEPVIRSESHANGLTASKASLMSRTFVECAVAKRASEIDAVDNPGIEYCPSECSYLVEDSKDTAETCTFKCVSAQQCGNAGNSSTRADQTWADPETGLCKFCPVRGCTACHNNTGKCRVCDEDRGWYLSGDTCKFDRSWYFWAFIVLAVAGVIYSLAWWLALCWRPVVNAHGELLGLRYRTSAKQLQESRIILGQGNILDPNVRNAEGLLQEQDRKLVPLLTNTLAKPVGGAGSVLYFRFQAFLIFLAFMTYVSWAVYVSTRSEDVSDNGTQNPKNWIERCNQVIKGKRVEDNEARGLAGFMFGIYIFCELATFVFAIWQKRAFNHLNDMATMQDFAAILEGVPPVLGTEKLEHVLRDHIQNETGHEVAGVSVAWTYQHENHVEALLEEDVEETEKMLEPWLQDIEGPDAATSTRHKLWFPLDFMLLATLLGIPLTEEPCAHADTAEDKTPQYLATHCVASNKAVVVFKTEAGRDAACQRETLLGKGKIQWGSAKLRMKPLNAEASGIMWRSVNIPRTSITSRVFQSIGIVLLAELIWAMCLYLPYACYVASFSYANGDEPSGMTNSLMGFLVPLGNQILYFVCLTCSERVGFFYYDTVMVMYMLLYMLAIFINVCFDMAVAVFASYSRAVGEHARTADGQLISSLGSWNEVARSYEIQHEVGEVLSAYAWPSTFFTPYVIEVAAAGWLIFNIQRRFVRSSAHLKGWKAEKAMSFFVLMDSSRYADVMSSLMVAELIWIVPSGFVADIFLYLTLSNIFVFMMDQHKALRWVPSWSISTPSIDSYALGLLGLCLGIIPAVGIFKINCINADHEHFDDATHFCVTDGPLVLLMLGVGWLSATLHWLVMTFLVPYFDDEQSHKVAEETYNAVAERTAQSWFNTNPMNCLRSKYVYQDNPPCTYYISGKQHVLQRNVDASCHFFDHRRVEKENYGNW
mmetsp:Transcript_98803/g.175961  ORF Transcript_98803/g.175961 Transcript_98803/m.175961 type:complete len:973 (+) Transcript_98803:74-2992(+)